MLTIRTEYVSPKQGNVFWRPNLSEIHGEEFFARIAVEADRHFVYGEKAKRFPVEDPHWMRIAIEDLLVDVDILHRSAHLLC